MLDRHNFTARDACSTGDPIKSEIYHSHSTKDDPKPTVDVEVKDGLLRPACAICAMMKAIYEVDGNYIPVVPVVDDDPKATLPKVTLADKEVVFNPEYREEVSVVRNICSIVKLIFDLLKERFWSNRTVQTYDDCEVYDFEPEYPYPFIIPSYLNDNKDPFTTLYNTENRELDYSVSHKAIEPHKATEFHKATDLSQSNIDILNMCDTLSDRINTRLASMENLCDSLEDIIAPYSSEKSQYEGKEVSHITGLCKGIQKDLGYGSSDSLDSDSHHSVDSSDSHYSVASDLYYYDRDEHFEPVY